MEQIYRTIVEDIKSKIHMGEYLDGVQLPSEEELKGIYHTSRSTVRKALKILSDEGYIYSVNRKGNFIKTPETKNYILYFDEEDRNFGIDQTELVSMNMLDCDPFISEIPDNYRVAELKSIFRSSEIPVGFDEKHIAYNKDLVHLTEELKSSNLLDILSGKSDIYRMKKTLTISGIQATKEIASVLNIKEYDYVIKVEHRYFDEFEKNIAYCVTYYRQSHIMLIANSDLQRGLS
jgi:DNA-binding GntR family transcriptional regulator